MKCHVSICPSPAQPEHTPCCGNHGEDMRLCCQHYCDSHWVDHDCHSDIHPSVIA